MRSPAWTREEVVLALDLYMRSERRILGPRDSKAIELSRILNQLDIHPAHLRPEDFRNPSSVGLKMANLRALDPSTDSVGLKSTSKTDREVWDEFSNDPVALREAAAAIRGK